MKSNIFSVFFVLTTFMVIQEVQPLPHEHTGILNIDVASEFFYTELKRLFKVIQDPIFKRLGDLLYHHEVDNVRDILTVFANPMTTKTSDETVTAPSFRTTPEEDNTNIDAEDDNGDNTENQSD